MAQLSPSLSSFSVFLIFFLLTRLHNLLREAAAEDVIPTLPIDLPPPPPPAEILSSLLSEGGRRRGGGVSRYARSSDGFIVALSCSTIRSRKKLTQTFIFSWHKFCTNLCLL